MDQGMLTAITAWESFYLIVGPSAAVLLGLQFVVITLGAEVHPPGSLTEVNAFGTPTVVHFCMVLFLSAAILAPWHRLASVATIMGAAGLGGLIYTLIVARRARRTTGYRPVLEDWIWHVIIPLVAYVVITIGAILLPFHPGPALFTIGAMALLLLADGIHNAWDTVTYMAVEGRKQAGRS